jgi:hypothetical protein
VKRREACQHAATGLTIGAYRHPKTAHSSHGGAVGVDPPAALLIMRPISQEVYGVARDRVIGSALALEYVGNDRGGTIVRKAEADYLDDGPQKPVRIWSRTGRRPVLAAGNANGDIPVLEFTQHADKPSLRLLILRDDNEREFGYASGEQALEQARLDDRQHETTGPRSSDQPGGSGGPQKPH